MISKKFGIVFSDTSRSRAYCQLLLDAKMIPSSILIMVPDESENRSLGEFRKTSKNEKYEVFEGFAFDPEKPIVSSLKEYGLPFRELRASSINEKLVIDAVKSTTEEYFIYSGFGGIILRKEVLGIGKKFIHVHGGFLPYYKGSTCNYYSIINENFIGAGSIEMREAIDEGPVFISKKFKCPDNKRLIDHYYDPLIRAIVLIETMNVIGDKQDSNLKPLTEQVSNMYYVIHPVLKHIAMLKL